MAFRGSQSTREFLHVRFPIPYHSLELLHSCMSVHLVRVCLCTLATLDLEARVLYSLESIQYMHS
jgi:hypothetical protein